MVLLGNVSWRKLIFCWFNNLIQFFFARSDDIIGKSQTLKKFLNQRAVQCHWLESNLWLTFLFVISTGMYDKYCCLLAILAIEEDINYLIEILTQFVALVTSTASNKMRWDFTLYLHHFKIYFISIKLKKIHTI